MGRNEFKAAYRQVRLVRQFVVDTASGFSLWGGLSVEAKRCRAALYSGDVLRFGYAGTGHRCGRRRPRFVGGPAARLPA